MQLEIKTIIDFGDDGPPADKMNDIFRSAVDRMNRHIAAPFSNTYGAKTVSHMGWTSSSDGEE